MGRSLTNPQRFEIEVQGLIYTTPLSPPMGEIRGSHLPKKDQIWYRREEYLQWDWSDNWETNASKAQLKWFEEEVIRLHNGDWIMINGAPTYFNKYCYFFHQWFVLQEGIYPMYKDTSLEYFRFYQLCEDDPVCIGDCGIKGRRVGLSSMSAAIKLLIALLENNTTQGIVSKTGVDAQEMFFFVKNALENLPKFLMPDLNKVTESEIHIAKPAKRITKNNTKASSDKGKNNRIDYRDTAENAYDQSRKRHMTVDEAAKWLKVNVLLFISKVMETLYVGASKIGHMSVFSTVNKGDKGGDNFRVIWDGSDHINGQKDVFGRTRSRLHRFFIAGYRGMLGYVGKYGESIIDTPTKEQTEYLKTWIDPTTGKKGCPNPYIGAKEYLESTRKMYENDPELLAEEIRKYPFTWQEVFRGANNKCNFNLEELNAQIEKVEEECRLLGQKENGRRGRFTKSDTGEKEFKDDPTGMWYILEFCKDNNKYAYKGSIKCPDNGAFGSAGLDTFANAKHTVDPGSDACLIVMKRTNILDLENSNYPIAMFLGRPEIKDDFHDQIFWGLEYYGIKMLAERAPTDWEDYAVRNRYASPLDHAKLYGYLITTRRANNSEVYGIPPQGSEYKEQHLTEMIEYAKFNMRKIRFLRLLKEMVKFDINERTDFDACMAFGYALIGLKEWQQVEKVVVSGKQFMKKKRSQNYAQKSANMFLINGRKKAS